MYFSSLKKHVSQMHPKDYKDIYKMQQMKMRMRKEGRLIDPPMRAENDTDDFSEEFSRHIEKESISDTRSRDGTLNDMKVVVPIKEESDEDAQNSDVSPTPQVPSRHSSFNQPIIPQKTHSFNSQTFMEGPTRPRYPQ